MDNWLAHTSLRNRFLLGKRKYATVGMPIAAVVVAFLVFQASTGPNGLFPPPANPLAKPTDDFLGGTKIQGPLFFQPIYNPCTQDYRPAYGLNCTVQETLFGKLPFFHADTYDIANKTWNVFVYGGNFDISSVGPDYWSQPEFFPAWRGEPQVREMLAQSDYQTPRGYGTYPWVRGWNVPVCSVQGQGRQALTSVDILRTGWNVTHWQGIGLYAAFPQAAYNLNGTVHFNQDPGYAAQRLSFKLSMANDTEYDGWRSNASFVPTQFPADAIDGAQYTLLLKPTNNPVPPYQGFSRDWVQPLNTALTLKGVQVGDRFVVSLYAVTPSDWAAQQYFWLFGRYWVDSGSIYGGPLMQYIIEVTAC